ncbi:hypothetical protein ACQH7H_23720, partial [Escherichia coli]|uniref:hypothetical protein n=1 Tax=Escherichia coli TaxID=562 RepID=UPI003CE8F830
VERDGHKTKVMSGNSSYEVIGYYLMELDPEASVEDLYVVQMSVNEIQELTEVYGRIEVTNEPKVVLELGDM